MTSKEAIKVLKEEKIYLSNYNTNEVLSAIEKDLTKLEILQKYCQVYEVDYLDKDEEYYLTIGMFESTGISKEEYKVLKNDK